jgi:limonene 1,2-monooxygenase
MGRLRFGLFLPPYHNPRHNHALAIERDLELVEHLDRLGYDAVWFGEHHSGGYEVSPCPELMIAAAAQRTRRIKLSTGVISVPYHHPLMVADRIAFLDHMTRGRCVFGMGPGALPMDSQMMGFEYTTLRPRMEEAVDAIIELLDSDEPVNRETEWFTLNAARLQVKSYSEPRVPIAIAAAFSPSGPRLAGKHGLELLSVASASAEGFERLAGTWEIVQDRAAQFGQAVSRSDWSLVGMMFVAETEEEARREAVYQMRDFFEYHHAVVPHQLWAEGEDIDDDEMIDRLNASGSGIVGTPKMAIEHLQRLEKQTGGFGSFLFFGADWGTREATLRNYELFAREVIPHFDGSTESRLRSFAWTKTQKESIADRLLSGWAAAQAVHDRDRAGETGDRA